MPHPLCAVAAHDYSHKDVGIKRDGESLTGACIKQTYFEALLRVRRDRPDDRRDAERGDKTFSFKL